MKKNKEKLPAIYSITNKVTKMLYIGYAINYKSRWRYHLNRLRQNQHHNRYLQNAWNKYGEENFKFERIEECNEEILPEREHYWCMLLNTFDKTVGYNIMKTGTERNAGLSDETKELCAAFHRGRKRSDETRKRMSEAAKKVRAIPSQAMIDSVQKRKDTIKNSGKVENEWLTKKVIRIDLYGNTKQWNRVKDCLKDLNISYIMLIKLINGTKNKNKSKNEIKLSELREYTWKIEK